MAAMQTKSNVQASWLSIVLNVPDTTGDDARRRRLLNMVLFAVFSLSVLLVLAGVIPIATTSQTEQEISTLQLQISSSLVMMFVSIGMWLVNRYISGVLAAWALVILLTGAIAVSDTPLQLTEGRSTFFFALPIMIAAVALRPRSTFIAATIATMAIILLTEGETLGAIFSDVNYAAIAGFYIIALLSWLASSSLEATLAELRAINAELDQRVALRTQELSDALTEVKAISSKNEAILASIADGVVLFDKRGLATNVNPAMTNLLDCTPDKILGFTISQLTKGGIERIDSTNLATNKRVEVDEKTLSVSLANVNVEGGQTGELVGVFRDFTREAQLERMKDSFVSMASHELRTPLNAILGYADMLRHGADGELNPAQENRIDRMIANSRRLLGLVNNMLDRAQLAAGRLNLHLNTYDPRDLVTEVEATTSILASTKDLKFTTDIADDVPFEVFGDRERLEQILVNLIGNAIKFTSKGGVSLKIERVNQTHLCYVVQDTGRGIPKKAQETIFLPFEQVDDPQTRAEQGTGLGLSIVKMLTELMGGTIQLYSEIDTGSTFTLMIPIRYEETELEIQR